MSVLLARRPQPLPQAITATERVDGYRGELWIVRPVDLDQMRAMEGTLAEMEERLRPGNRDVRIAMLARLSVHYPNVAKDEGALSVILADLADDLAEFSDLHVAWACADWRRTESWWPKSGELREKCLQLDCWARVYRRRARVLMALEPPHQFELPAPPRGEPQPLSPARKAEIEAAITPGPLARPLRELLNGA